MGEKIKTSLDWLRTTKLTPIQLFYVVFGIFVFIFMETQIFESLNDFIKAAFWITIVVVGILLGVSVFNVKKLALEMKAIFEENNMTNLEKVNAFGNLSVIVLSKFGKAFDMLNLEYGINTYKKTEPKTEPEEPGPVIIKE